MTGFKTRRLTHAKGEEKKLPLAIATSYSFYDLEFMETQVTIAIPTGDGIMPMQLAKHQAKMIEAFNHTVIFALESVASYQIARLTQAKVDFIVPGKIVFIPSMLIVLRELKNTVALRWLVTNGIIALTGGKQKHVHITMSKEEIWKKSLPLMTSPIERILFTDKKPEGGLMAGETAMGHYTMLAEPATPVIAIAKATAKENAAMMNKEYGDIKVEVWKYSPALLSENEWADRLSLYLCMKDSEDERIQMECDTLIKEIKW